MIYIDFVSNTLKGPINSTRWQPKAASAFQTMCYSLAATLLIITQTHNTIYIYIYFFFPNTTTCPFVDFVVLPPGHGRSVTDFWGWDAHEVQLRCPDDVWVVIEEEVVPGGVLNLNSTNLPRPWSPRESFPSRKIPTVEPGIEPGTSWLVVRDSDH